MKKIILFCVFAWLGLCTQSHAQSQIKVLHRADQSITVDGIIDGQWKASNRVPGGNGLEWYVALDGQNLYVARKGGDNGQPQLMYIQAKYAGAALSNQPFNYDNFVPDFAGIGGINFVAYLKSGYDEFRTRSTTAWSQAQIALSPAYGSGAVNTMEMFIPWNFITDNLGTPDSISIVFYQTTGNAANIQSFGAAPDNLLGANPVVTNAFKVKVLNRIAAGSTINFGNVGAGESRDTTILVQNFGDQTLNIGTPTVSTNQFSIPQMPAGVVPMKLGNVVSETPMKVRFSPSSAGAKTAVLTIPSNDPVTPQYVINLQGGATQATPKIRVKYGALSVPKADSIRLGNAVLGDSVTRKISIVNIGAIAANVTSASVSGVNFNLVSTSAPLNQPIAIGDSVNIFIKYKPSQANVISIGGLQLATDDPDNAVYTAVLKASSFTPAPEITVTSNTVNYNTGDEFNVGTALVGNNTLTLLTIKNTGDAPLSIQNIGIANSTEFTIQGTIPTSIAAGASADLFVRFEPSSAGAKTGLLNISNNDANESQFTLNLKGVGIAGPSPDINVVRVEANPRKIDGTIEAGWPGAFIGGTLDWHITWSRDSVYFAKKGGGGGNEPVLIYLKASYKNAQFTANNTPSTSMPYDGFAPNFAAMGGINFVAFVKSDYDEYRTWNAMGGAWSANNTSLNPHFGANNTMEIAIPWSAITRGNGLPDSLRWVSYQTNGNAGSLFAYGQMPNSNPFGANLTPAISQWENRYVTIQQPHNSTFNFGTLAVGTSTDTTFTIQNLGEADLNLSSTSILQGTDFSIVSATPSGLLAPLNGLAHVRVRYAPTSAGNKTAQLTITSNDSEESPYIVNLLGTTPAVVNTPTLIVKNKNVVWANNATFSYGNVSVGSSRDTTFFIVNKGTATLNLGNATVSTSDFSIVTAASNSVAPNDSTAITVRFAPTSAGSKSSTLNFGSNDPNQTTFNLNLQGVGILLQSGLLVKQISTNSAINNGNNLGFGSVAVGSSSDIPLRLVNTGNATLTMSISISNAVFSIVGTAPFSIAAGDSTELVLRVTPAALGVVASDFMITSNAPNSPYILTLTANGINTNVPVLVVKNKNVVLGNGSTFNYGNAIVGTGIDTVFTLYNKGTAVLNMSNFFLTPNNFAILSTVGSTLAPNDSTTAVIRFAPNSVGQKTGTISFNTNDPNQTAFSATLQGTGVAAPAPRIRVRQGGDIYASGGTFAFGWRNTNTPDQADFVISNYGTDTLRLGTPTLTGSDKFTLATASFRAKIAPNDSAVLGVNMNSAEVGDFSASIQVAHNANTATTPFILNVTVKVGKALTWTPANPTIDSTITLTYNANLGNGALRNVGKVFIHTGVITSSATGTDWTYVQGTWATAADSVKLDSLGDGLHRISYPIKSFYNLPNNLTVYRLGMVFRDASGTFVGKETDNSDFFVPIALTTSTRENIAGQVRIYPNPTRGQLYVSLPAEKAQVTISDVWGKVVKQLQLTENQSLVDLGDAANGVYFVQVKTATQVTTHKLLLNK